MTKKDELTMQEMIHVITDILFASREKWGDEIFINYSGHVDGIVINIHSGKWVDGKEYMSIDVDKFVTFDEVLNDLDNYYELGFQYFIDNDRYYWYKGENFIKQFGESKNEQTL